MTHRIANRGSRPAPVALGAHPYLRLDHRSVDDLVFSTSARRAVQLDARNIPTGSFPVEGTAFDLRHGCRVRDMPRHAVYTDLRPHPGPRYAPYGYRHRLGDPVAGDAVVLEAGPDFAWLQTYVTDRVPGHAAGRARGGDRADDGAARCAEQRRRAALAQPRRHMGSPLGNPVRGFPSGLRVAVRRWPLGRGRRAVAVRRR